MKRLSFCGSVDVVSIFLISISFVEYFACNFSFAPIRRRILLFEFLMLTKFLEEEERKYYYICGWVIFVNYKNKTCIICTFFRDGLESFSWFWLKPTYKSLIGLLLFACNQYKKGLKLKIFHYEITKIINTVQNAPSPLLFSFNN